MVQGEVHCITQTSRKVRCEWLGMRVFTLYHFDYSLVQTK